MISRILSIIGLLTVLSLNAFGQGYTFHSQLIQHKLLPNYNTKPNEYNALVQNVNNALKEFTLEDSSAIELLVVSHTESRNTIFSIHCKPEMETSKIKKLRKKLNKLPAFQCKAFPLTILFMARKAESDLPFSPELQYPNKEAQQAFYALNGKDQFTSIQNWTNEELYPFLVDYFDRQPNEKQGAFNLALNLKDAKRNGELLSTILCDSNNYYWRGLLESKKNPFDVILINSTLLIAEGKYEAALNYIQLGLSVSSKDDFTHWLLEEMNWRIQSQLNRTNSLIEEAYSLHENNVNSKDLLQSILSYNPLSAQTRNAITYIETDKMLESNMSETSISEQWLGAKDTILLSDPFFNLEFTPTTPEMAFTMYRRLEIDRLVNQSQGTSFTVDEFRELAEIAVDLDETAYAALVYWHLIQQNENSDANQDLRWFIYCLNKLKVNQITEFFNADIVQESAALDEEVENRKKSSPYFKAF